MKIKLFTIVIIILFPIILFAQHSINKGLKFAYTTSNIYHNKIDNFASRRSGFNIALFLEFRYNFDFSDSFSSIKEVSVKNNSYDFWLGITF